MTFHKFLSFISAPPTCFRKKRMSIIKLRRTEHSIPFHNVPFHTFVMYLLYVDIFVVCRGRQIDSSRPALAFTAEMNQQFVPEAIPRGKKVCTSLFLGAFPLPCDSERFSNWFCAIITVRALGQGVITQSQSRLSMLCSARSTIGARNANSLAKKSKKSKKAKALPDCVGRAFCLVLPRTP